MSKYDEKVIRTLNRAQLMEIVESEGITLGPQDNTNSKIRAIILSIASEDTTQGSEETKNDTPESNDGGVNTSQEQSKENNEPDDVEVVKVPQNRVQRAIAKRKAAVSRRRILKASVSDAIDARPRQALPIRLLFLTPSKHAKSKRRRKG